MRWQLARYGFWLREKCWKIAKLCHHDQNKAKKLKGYSRNTFSYVSEISILSRTNYLKIMSQITGILSKYQRTNHQTKTFNRRFQRRTGISPWTLKEWINSWKKTSCKTQTSLQSVELFLDIIYEEPCERQRQLL